MQIDIYSWLKTARTLASNTGLSLTLFEVPDHPPKSKEEARQRTPRTDGRLIYMPSPQTHWTDDDRVKWWGAFYHEIGHNVPEMRDCFTMARDKNLDMRSFLGTLVNILDDYRQEHFRYDEYIGKWRIMDKSHGMVLEKHITDKVFGKQDEAHRNAVEAVYAIDTKFREDWYSHCIGKAERIEQQMTGNGKSMLQTLRDNMDAIDFNNMQTAEDVYENALAIIRLLEFNPEEEEQASKAESSERDGQEGEDTGNEGKQGKGRAEGEGEGDEKDGADRIRYDDLLKHNHAAEHTDGPSYAPLEISYDDGWAHGQFELDTNPELVGINSLPARGSGYREAIERHLQFGKGFASKVRRVLQINSRARNTYGHKTGKLHSKNAYRLTMRDAKGYNERVFKQKHEKDILDVSVTVLGDHSGSMGGEKFVHMALSSIRLTESLSALGIPLELLGFTERGHGSTHIEYKRFNQRIGTEQLIDSYSRASHLMGCNADGESVMWAYSRLKQQPTKRKILIVLSDGQPASNRGDAAGHLEQVVQGIEKEGAVEIYGIGIQSDSVRHFYKQHSVINQPEELESTLLSLISKKIIKGENQ